MQAQKARFAGGRVRGKMQQGDGIENRRYIRLGTVFPIEFEIASLDDKEVFCAFHQSFTRNVSEGGMCLEVNNLKEDLVERLNKKAAKLRLQINMPFSAKPIFAVAEASWIKQIKQTHPNKYLIGISYEEISEIERRKIVNFSRFLRLKPVLTAAALVILAIAVAIAGIQVSKKETLRRAAEQKLALVEEERLRLIQSLDDVRRSRGELELRLKELEGERKDLEKKLDAAKTQAQTKPDEIARLEAELISAKNKSEELNKKLADFTASRGKIEEELKALEEIKASKPVKVALAAGGIVVGKVVLETTNSIRVEVPAGVITLNRDQISSIATPTDAELAELAEERLKMEQRAKEFARQIEIEAQKEAKRRKEESIIVAKTEAGKPEISIPKRTLERGVAIKDNRIYADGGLFFIKGVAYGISAPGLQPGVEASFSKIPLSVFENDFRMMKEAGINTIRTYEPLPDQLLDLADKYNMKIIEQVVYPSAYTDYSSPVELKALKKIAVETVKKHKNRKCILMWIIWNDAPFCYEEPGNPVPRYGFDTVNNFLKEIYLAVKATDKNHPVTAANILKVKGYDLGFDFLDVIGCNAYVGGHGFNWRGEEEAAKSVSEMNEISKKYNKPVFITETGYSTFVKKEVQDKALEAQIKSVGENLAGVVIFEWADEWWKGGNPAVQDKHIEEYWGILTWDRKPKPGFEVVSKLFRSIPTDSLGYSEPRPN